MVLQLVLLELAASEVFDQKSRDNDYKVGQALKFEVAAGVL